MRLVSGCTFEEDPDVSLCEYRQGQEDDFDWQLVRTTSWSYVPSDLTRGAVILRSRLFLALRWAPLWRRWASGRFCADYISSLFLLRHTELSSQPR
ncbi:hypothetical protein MHYP_G00303000 [Metynnis hypsauchen]